MIPCPIKVFTHGAGSPFRIFCLNRFDNRGMLGNDRCVILGRRKQFRAVISQHFRQGAPHKAEKMSVHNTIRRLGQSHMKGNILCCLP